MRKTLLASFFLICFFIIAGCGGSSSSSSQDTSPVQLSPGSALGSITIANTALQFSETTSVSATFKKTDGTPASGINVNFSTTLGTITPASGIVNTDTNGTATVQLTVGAISGQGQITASATVDNKQITKTGLFSVSLPPLKLTPISLGLSTLSYGGSTSVSVTIMDANGVTYTGQEVDVTFSSTQASSGKATISSPVRTVNGVATVTYQAITATGSDTITAAITGDSKTANITVNALAASSITFVSANPINIGLKGMGGAGIQETSLVTFKVFDTAGQPKANQQVDFALNTTVGGLSLSSYSGSTANDGTVSTIVQAGIIATSVRITATLRGITPVIATQSDQLVVSTGVPAQDGFSISIETLNPEAWNTDGVIDKVTARLSDHFHNPVPDGTAVYFTTSGGSIQPSCTTIAGACTVNWTSQNPRPLNGRARILAYAVGEEAFLDLNGNGYADAAEFTDDSEAFRDDNESGVKNAAETFIDFNSDGVFNGPDIKYNGVLQGAAYVGAPKSKHVFSNSTLVMASSAAKITSTCNSVLPGSYAECNVTVSDENGNSMPAGTTVNIKITTTVQGTWTGFISDFSLNIPIFDTYTFPNTNSNSGVLFPITISDSNSKTTAPIGILEVKVTSPGGLVTPGTFRIN
ncbi:MAG: Ig-like domain-containing protein [Desulfuromonadaceae bacterium]|nr:Ig-like domain-containing protein [Desulfuromonadaceae bacterium]